MTDATAPIAAAPRATPLQVANPARDLRLDFYRGLAMFIILIAHTPGNVWALWIPARFGFSDATEIFVFCSGMASAIAFGRVYSRQGWAMGTARVAFRVWQVYWAHIGVFLAIVAAMVALNDLELTSRNYVSQLNLWPFLGTERLETGANLVGLMTLTYVPNYFDILPMYLVVLAMMPVAMGLARITPWLALAGVAVVWAGAQADILWLPAEPWSDREWFFNPFGWQLVFFTGFAFMLGWLPRPPVTWPLIAVALAAVVLTVPVAWYRLHQEVALFADMREVLSPLIGKTDFGFLRYVHFLALAYLAWVVAGEGGARLVAQGPSIPARLARLVLTLILKVGQQSLAVFVVSMLLARLMGFALDYLGRSSGTVTAINLTGFAVLIGVAYGAGWFKTHPWRQKTG